MNELSVISKVNEVVVYPDRARVTVVADVELQEGNHRISVDELPMALIPQSIRVGGKGEAKVRITSVDVRHSYYERTPVEKIREIEDTIEEIDDERQILVDEESVLRAQGEYFDGLGKATTEYAKGLARGKTKVDDYGRLSEFLRSQEFELRASIRNLVKKKRELDRRLEKLKNELKLMSSGRAKQGYLAVIDLEVGNGGSFLLKLTYVIRNSSWRPMYDIRLDESEEGYLLDITILAEIKQRSGLDWEEVSLSVSTARPAISQRAPELKPWYVDEYRPLPPPQPRKMVAPARTDVLALAQSAPATSVAQSVDLETVTEVEAGVAVATLEKSGTTASFRVAGSSDIPGDGSPHKTTIDHFNVGPDIDFLAIPKQVDAVFRRVKFKNTTGAPFLAGYANLFAATEFIGGVNVEHTAPGDELELLFGPEERITVERELTQREVEKTRLRDRRELGFGYEITLHNHLDEQIEIEVQDHIPVSKHEDIKVKLDHVQPEPDEESDLKLMTWQLVIPADGESSIQYEFGISHPRQMRVIGLVD